MSIAEMFFRAILRTAPREFRRNYGVAVKEAFAEGLADRRARSGTSAARVFALRAYGDMLWTSLEEHAGAVGKDAAFALRLIARSWQSSAVVIVTLAVAIGICAATFGTIDAVLFAPFPYQDPSRLTFIFDRTVDDPAAHGSETSLPDSLEWPALATSFSSMGSFANWLPTRTNITVPKTLFGQLVTTGFFDTMGVHAALGRLFNASDARPGATRTIVISESFWKDAFGSSPAAIGETLVLNDLTYRIIGVVPSEFVMPRTQAFGERPREVFRPIAVDFTPRSSHYLTTVARLRPGISAQEAQADMDRVAATMRERYPEIEGRQSEHVVSMEDELLGPARTMLAIAFAAMLGIAFIACLNVTNILLARIAQREKELAVRMAVGASRGRLLVQLLVESGVFAGLGGLLGLSLCVLLVHFAGVLGPDIPRLESVRVSPVVLLFTVFLTGACAICIGVMPALTVTGTNVAAVLKEAGRGGSGARGRWMRFGTVVLELALALVLVTACGLLVRSFIALSSVDVGFAYDDVVATNTLLLPPKRYPPGPSRAAFARAMLSALQTVPGLETPGVMVSTPLANENYDAEEFRIAGRAMAPARQNSVEYDAVTPGALQSLRIRLVRGRLLNDADTEGSEPVAIVTKAFVQRYLGDDDAIGKGIFIAYGTPSRSRTIVGVVNDFKMESLTQNAAPLVMVPYDQDAASSFQIVGRSGTPAAKLAVSISTVIRGLDPKLPERSVESYAAYLRERRAGASAAATIVGFMAFVALLLATIGTYGVVSYNVGQRTREFGIRRALGAGTSMILAIVLKQTALLATIGLLVGFAMSVGGSSAISSLLYQVSPFDPPTFVCVAAILLGAALGAALPPAIRAMNLDPVATLRDE